MPRIALAVVAWVVLGLVGAWFADAMSHAGAPRRVAQLIPPAWVLFELWAVGFVVLGTVGARVLDGRHTPKPKTISAILAWTVLWIVLVGLWAVDPAATFIGSGPGQGGPVALKPPDCVLFDAWALGLVVVGAASLAARLRSARPRRLGSQM